MSSSTVLENIQFIDSLWLRAYGLNRENVLDYFALSPFYDPKSNNEALRTQGAGPEHLQNMIGLEFVLEASCNHEPVLFVVKKQMRSSPRVAEVLDVYYVSAA